MSNPNAPAHPIAYMQRDPTSGDFQVAWTGLTKREAFAMAAMQGLVSNPSVIGPDTRCGWSYVNCTPEQLAVAALDQANAMLGILAKEENGGGE